VTEGVAIEATLRMRPVAFFLTNLPIIVMQGPRLALRQLAIHWLET
jgi:hypothetical protein